MPVPPWVVLTAIGTVALVLALWNFASEVRSFGLGYGPLIAAAMGVSLASGVLYVAVKLRVSDLDPVESWTVTAAGIGVGLFTTLGFGLTVLIRVVENRPVTEPLFPVVVMSALGLLGGVVIGREHVETKRLTTSAKESRDAMAFTNSLLRHDVRNGLQIIGGHANALAGHEDEQVDESAHVIAAQTEGLNELIGEVESVTNVLTDDLEPEPVDLALVVEDVVEACREGHDAMTVEHDVPAELPVEGADALYPVLRNLVENAAKHAETDDVHVRVGGDRSDDTVEVRVGDNGTGVPETERDRIFERGISSDGGGHGLYVADTLVDRLDGDIHVEESALGGAAFVLTLPAAEDQKSQDDGNPFSG